jgi:hypothetical protein
VRIDSIQSRMKLHLNLHIFSGENTNLNPYSNLTARLLRFAFLQIINPASINLSSTRAVWLICTGTGYIIFCERPKRPSFNFGYAV